MRSISRRNIFLIIITVLSFSVAGYFIASMVNRPQKEPITHPGQYVERGGVDTAYINFEPMPETSAGEKKIEKEQINLSELIAAGFTFLCGVIGLVKIWDRADGKANFDKVFLWMAGHDKCHADMKPIFDNLTDQRNREDVLKELVHIKESALMFCHNVKLRVLIEDISNRTIEFTESNMNENYNQELYDYAMTTIESKVFEGQQQLRQMQLKEEFRKEFLLIQAECCIQLRTDLKRIVDDSMINHKYRRFGDTAKSYLKNYLSLVIEAFNVHEIK